MLDKKGPNSILKYSVAQKPKISDLKKLGDICKAE